MRKKSIFFCLTSEYLSYLYTHTAAATEGLSQADRHALRAEAAMT